MAGERNRIVRGDATAISAECIGLGNCPVMAGSTVNRRVITHIIPMEVTIAVIINPLVAVTYPGLIRRK
jgi:ABC-type uncharacterized transport system permease subunit